MPFKCYGCREWQAEDPTAHADERGFQPLCADCGKEWLEAEAEEVEAKACADRAWAATGAKP